MQYLIEMIGISIQKMSERTPETFSGVDSIATI
jgi:hypothetical protein